ncbi:glucosaminidase domain-containing protein [Cohnella luojiensis]|uniref:Mannosyl-glycoprotein endo-beta-N-acetylglucosamidase-like domain-containing protein n=1 Tax=Cohnella luojiensis TaxID=652876 RepID=A0A4Y8M2W1_9BACL|nr:glucosaminidase domain-containing protein [Cohnella luojiensis]TFE26335.1 hypothetical protein E2980_12040 [Cohnella luojiensis]
MRRELIRRLFIYGLGVTLILTLGMRFHSANHDASTPISSESPTIPKSHPPLISPYPLAEPIASPAAQVSKEVPDIAKNAGNEVHISASPTKKPAVSSVQTYKVTAYYLNVRANAYAKSKVLKVVQMGTLLEVLQKIDNGWLRLNGGGYVHGDYAELVDGEIQTAKITPLQQLVPLVMKNSEDVQVTESGNPVKPTSTVGTASGLSEEDIAMIFDGTDLAGHRLEEAILEVEEEYGINALFTIAVMKLESGNGSSRLAKNKNNLFGLNASGADPHKRAFSFETKGDSVRKFGQLLSKNYVGKGYTTIEKIATKYCPANSKWSGLVKNIMKRDYSKLN